MEAGDVKGPVDIQGGPVIVKLIERKEGTYVPFEDVQKKIYDELLKNKREESFANYLEELKEKAVIRYMN